MSVNIHKGIISRYLKKNITIFFILLFFSTAVIIKESFADNQKTFLWKVQSKTNTVYILGSIHFMKKEAYPLNKKIERAFESSDVLAVEANINDLTKIDFQKVIETAIYPGNETLENHVSKETYELIRKELELSGIPLLLVNKQKPWFLALTLTSLKLIQLGFDPTLGIDIHFLSKAKGNKKIKELESIEYQINLLSNFTDQEQETFLLYTLKDIDFLERDADRLLSAWTNGDIKTTETIITKALWQDRKMSSIYEKLIYERNRNITSKIEEFLRTNEIHFVVVGAGHLIGKKGIIEMLREKGYPLLQL
ncbi:MAG: TraB/GumN family protein [Nitrospirae bacterium]|nr:TraB/GumN family protein [Nitrospirota bacterium]